MPTYVGSRLHVPRACASMRVLSGLQVTFNVEPQAELDKEQGREHVACHMKSNLRLSRKATTSTTAHAEIWRRRELGREVLPIILQSPPATGRSADIPSSAPCWLDPIVPDRVLNIQPNEDGVDNYLWCKALMP